MQNVTHLLRARRFVPLFSTQFLGAFNDSLFKQGVVLFVTYQLYSDAAREAQFSAIAQGLFILPFFLLSALAGQLADDHDKARLIRIIKTAEILIMISKRPWWLLENERCCDNLGDERLLADRNVLERLRVLNSFESLLS